MNASKDLLHTHARCVCTCRAWLSLHPLFSAYPLLGTYLLTTYTYKRIRLLTRVYGTSAIVASSVALFPRTRAIVSTKQVRGYFLNEWACTFMSPCLCALPVLTPLRLIPRQHRNGEKYALSPPAVCAL